MDRRLFLGGVGALVASGAVGAKATQMSSFTSTAPQWVNARRIVGLHVEAGGLVNAWFADGTLCEVEGSDGKTLSGKQIRVVDAEGHGLDDVSIYYWTEKHGARLIAHVARRADRFGDYRLIETTSERDVRDLADPDKHRVA